jgi:acetyl-CoA acetyltransferase
MGNVVSAASGKHRRARRALKGGLHDHVAALTINKVCGSGSRP